MNPGPSAAENRAMSSVFIGNVHWDVTEEQLKSFFSDIGPIINFRLFTEKVAGKPKVAFCEFGDPDTAIRAIGSFGGYEFKGLHLTVDLATSEKCRPELERLGSLVEAGDALDSSTDKAPEEISKAVASLPAGQMFELMKQMKMCIENNPQEARNLLLQNPQLAYALLQAQVIMRIVDPQVAVKVLNRSTMVPGVPEPKMNEPMPAAGPVTEVPPSFPPAALAPEPVTVNPTTPLPPQGLNVPVRPPMNPVPGIMPVMPSQFADQDLRSMADQDLRQMPALVGDHDMRAPPVMMGADKDMRQPMGDHDFRTFGLPPPMVENRPFDPRFRNMPVADPRTATNPAFDRPRPGNMDPRTVYEARNVGGPVRVEDPRKASMTAALNSRLSAAGPALQSLNPGMMNIGGPHPAMGPHPAQAGPDEQEKAALIMQVLQLTDQQIAMLPPEQRQSIIVLKEQLARSQL